MLNPSAILGFALPLVFTFTTAVLPGQTVVYFNDFEGAIGAEWSRSTTEVTPMGGRRFLGRYGGSDTVSLTLNALPGHDQIDISLDLFIIETWDGNGTVHGTPDIWTLDVTGSGSLVHTTFSAVDCSAEPQAYPGSYPGSTNPAGAGAVEIGTLGYPGNSCHNSNDSVYHLAVSLAHSSGSIVFTFSGIGLQPANDESWGLDNVQVSTRLTSVVATYSTTGAPCSGIAGIPTLNARNMPRIGTAFTVDVTNLTPLAIPFMVLGFSSSTWSGGSLPYPITQLGPPTCNLLVSPDGTVYVPNVAGTATWTLAIPNSALLLGVQFYNQCIAPAVPAGISASNRGDGVVGNT